MKNKLSFVLILLTVLGSAVISNISTLNANSKSFFYAVAATILIIVGLIHLKFANAKK
ncbi:MAG: hypothetical protein Q4P34_01875 [Tissierellia bacterium]|nr:hypothetical protein [Tissierellia bacterium]